LLDVDPVGLVRGKRGQHEGGTLDQYVNDRPYVHSSFLRVAMGRAFGTAMSGRSKGGQELADTWSGSRAEILAPNDRLLFVNSPWDWKQWRDSYTKNPFAEFMSAFLVGWRWKANPLTQGCRIAPENR